MSRETARLIARLLFCCAAAFAYVGAIVPAGPDPFGNDKLNHAVAFITLAILARLGWSRGGAHVIGLGLVAFGAAIELSQALRMIHRDASWADLLADAVAVLLGLVVGTLLLKLVRRALPSDAKPSARHRGRRWRGRSTSTVR